MSHAAWRLAFDLPQFLFEINDHETKFRFWSSLNKSRCTKNEISNFNQSRDHQVFEISLLIHFDLLAMDQKRNLEQIESEPKAEFRLVIINFEEKLGLIKS